MNAILRSKKHWELWHQEKAQALFELFLYFKTFIFSLLKVISYIAFLALQLVNIGFALLQNTRPKIQVEPNRFVELDEYYKQINKSHEYQRWLRK